MKDLVLPDGSVQYGLFEEEIENICFEDFNYVTPMGYKLPEKLKRYKVNQFNFFGICGPDIMLAMAVIDLKFLSSGFVYIFDRNSGDIIETQKMRPFGKCANIAPTPDSPNSWFKSEGLSLEIRKNRVFAESKDLKLEASLHTENTKPLRLCTRTGYTGWAFTQKTTPISVSAQIRTKNGSTSISSPEYLGVMDWSGGYMRRHTFWNWASSACILPNGSYFGLNLSCGVNETSFTENAFWIDGKRTKVDMVDFEYSMRNVYQPWRISSYDGKVDLIFTPEKTRSEKVNTLFLASNFTQLMGSFHGSVVTDNKERIEIGECYGWTEDHYAKW